MRRPSRTNTRNTRARSAGLTGVFVRDEIALGLGASGEREGLAEQMQRSVVAAENEAGV